MVENTLLGPPKTRTPRHTHTAAPALLTPKFISTKRSAKLAQKIATNLARAFQAAHRGEIFFLTSAPFPKASS